MFTKQGPRTLTPLTFAFRIAAAFAGGVGGTLSFFIAFFLAGTLIPPNKENPLSLFIVLSMAFIGTLVTNILSTIFLSYADPEKFKKHALIGLQVFIANIVLFVFSVPLYLIAAQVNMNLALPASVHLLISTQISALILEIFSASRHILVRIYGIALGSLIAFGIVLLFFAIKQESIVIFIIMPLFWTVIELCGGIIELIYNIFYRTYGIDVFEEK